MFSSSPVKLLYPISIGTSPNNGIDFMLLNKDGSNAHSSSDQGQGEQICPSNSNVQNTKIKNNMDIDIKKLLSPEMIKLLKCFIVACNADPNIFHIPKLLFFKSFLLSLGARLPDVTANEPKHKPSIPESSLTTVEMPGDVRGKGMPSIDQPTIVLDDTALFELPDNYMDNVNVQINTPLLPHKYSAEIPSKLKNSTDNMVTMPKVLVVNSASANKPFHCIQCNRSYPTQLKFKRHMRIHTDLRPFKCKYCGRNFTCKTFLQNHIRTHTGERPFRCKQCNKSYSYEGQLKIHMRNHTGERPYKCTQCEKTFVLRQHLKEHILSHSEERQYQCKQCNKAFKLQSHPLTHISGVHNKKRFECLQCDKGFSRGSYLKVHMMRHNGESRHICNKCGKPFNTLSCVTKHMEIHSEESQDTFTCYYCKQNFISGNELLAHMPIHSEDVMITGKIIQQNQTKHGGYECSYCGKIFLKKFALKRHTIVHTGEKPYKCKICEMTFARSWDLSGHMKTHDEVELYRCSHCDKSYLNNTELAKHLKIHNEIEVVKPYKCQICEKTYSTKQNLKDHMDGTHDQLFIEERKKRHSEIKEKGIMHKEVKNDEKKVEIKNQKNVGHECSYCGKIFLKKQSLKRHTLIHTGEKPYKCKICEMNFTRSWELTGHMKTHNEVELYKCSDCDRSYLNNTELSKHLKTHTEVERPHKCQICQKTFLTVQYLKSHIKTHDQLFLDKRNKRLSEIKAKKDSKIKLKGKKYGYTNDNECNSPEFEGKYGHSAKYGEYVCSYCDRTLPNKSSLKRHIKIHTGKELYKCKICELTFELSRSLNDHMKTHDDVELYQCSHCDKSYLENRYLMRHLKTHTELLQGISNGDIDHVITEPDINMFSICDP